MSLRAKNLTNMEKQSPKYDIFISYRRVGGAQYARILQLKLAEKGYNVFLDYDELTDGVFKDHIIKAIKSTTIFIVVLSCGALERCKNENDLVRQEIELALSQNKRIVPVNPDNSFDGIPEDIPEAIKDAISSHQHSEVNFGQALGVTVDLMVKNRIAPYIGKKHNYLKIFVVSAILAVIAIAAGCVYVHNREQARLALMSELTLDDLEPLWYDEVTSDQLMVIKDIFDKMVPVSGGEYLMGAAPDSTGAYDADVDTGIETPQIAQTVGDFMIGQYEVTVAQWHGIMGDKYEQDYAQRPIANVSYDDCCEFVTTLNNLTGLDFRLPTEAEWEYAARGGQNTKYAGSDDLNEVAWTDGVPHDCDGATSGKYCNGYDLFDMSGNVSEWCDTPFREYKDSTIVIDPDAMVVRGGNFDSQPYQMRVTAREPMNRNDKTETIGLRLVISK